MTVFENVAYPLKLRGIKGNEAEKKVAEVLELVGLAGLQERPSPALSGGQQQRVALARALVFSPRVLLLDEPFSNLDAQLREEMRRELKSLQQRLGITVLFVTHDQIEALSLSDRIAIMKHGQLEQVGGPEDVYYHPATPFVRDFLGKTFLLAGKVLGIGISSSMSRFNSSTALRSRFSARIFRFPPTVRPALVNPSWLRSARSKLNYGPRLPKANSIWSRRISSRPNFSATVMNTLSRWARKRVSCLARLATAEGWRKDFPGTEV